MSHNPETSHTGNTAGSVDLTMVHDHIDQFQVLAQRTRATANKLDDRIAMLTLVEMIIEQVNVYPSAVQVDVAVQGRGDTRHDVWIHALIDCDGTVLHTFDPITDWAEITVKLWNPPELYAWSAHDRPHRPHAVIIDIDRMLHWLSSITRHYS